MLIAPIANKPAPAPPLPLPRLDVQMTWYGIRKPSQEQHQLVLDILPRSGRPLSFDEAVAAARQLVLDGTPKPPGAGSLAPVHAVVALGSLGYVPARVRTTAGAPIAIDGDTADGRAGRVLRAMSVNVSNEIPRVMTVSALVGAANVLDLRKTTRPSFWRRESSGTTPGEWMPSPHG